MSGGDPNDTAISDGQAGVRSKFDVIAGLGLGGFIFEGAAPLVPPPMLIKGILPFDGIGFVGGQSGAGKTFVVTNLAVALAGGLEFFGHPVRERVGVIIVAAEGRAMLPARIAAARLGRISPAEKLPIAWVTEVPALATAQDLKRFGSRLTNAKNQFDRQFGVRLGAVIFDTVASVFDLEDEDDNSEIARVIRKMRELGNASGALILPVHHYGKSAHTGLRGGSSWRAGADVIISVLADRDEISGKAENRRLVIAKARDGMEGPIGAFSLRWVDLGVDGDGAPFGTCVVDPLSRQPSLSTRATADRMSRAVRTFRDAFGEALDHVGADFAIAGGPIVRAVQVQDVRTQFTKRYATGESDAKKQADATRKAFGRTLESMGAQFATEIRDGTEWIWRTQSL